jgi:hypothetical protein
MDQRVRHEWYRRWLEQPQRLQPGTRMPMVFPDGRSTLPDVLHGDADAQADAMWAYLSLGTNLPLPDGLEPPKGLALTPRDRPLVLRTFMPDAGSRAVAVGFPDGVALAFDAATCRLAYAWSGGFLDATPVWTNRGGAPAKPLGHRFWTAPPDGPWEVTTLAALPTGKSQARFAGYAVDTEGRPTFRYRVPGPQASLDVDERPAPLRNPAGVGLARHFRLQMPPGQTAWLRVGESAGTPHGVDADGRAVALALQADAIVLPAAGQVLLLPQAGERAELVGVPTAPGGTQWHLRRRGNGWQVWLNVSGAGEVRLHTWVPFRNEAGHRKELVK